MSEIFFVFKTPKSMDSVSLTMDEQEKYHCFQEHFEYKDNQACLDRNHRKDIMDAIGCIATREMSHAQPKTSTYEDRPPFGTSGNNGNNTPPRSRR